MAINLQGYSAWGAPTNLAALQQIGFQGGSTGAGEGKTYLQGLYNTGGVDNYQKIYDYQQARKGLQSTYDPSADGLSWITQQQLQPPPAASPTSNASAGVYSPEINQSLLKQIGFNGAAGGGNGDAYLKQLYGEGRYTDLANYQAWRQTLQPGYTLSTAGIALPTGTQVTKPAYDQGGVETVGQVEPLTDWQLQGLTALATPQTAGNANFASADSLAGSIGGYLQQGAAPITAAGLAGDAATLNNPFQKDVVDATVNTLNEQAAAARARLTASGAGRRSFGDSSSAIQMSELDKNSNNTLASTVAGLNYQGHNDSLNSALGIANSNRSNAFTGANTALTGASTMAGLGTDARNRALQDITNKIGAGNQLQNQNQRLADATNGQLSSLYGYDANQLNAFTAWLNGIPSSSSQSGTGSSQNGILSIFK